MQLATTQCAILMHKVIEVDSFYGFSGILMSISVPAHSSVICPAILILFSISHACCPLKMIFTLYSGSCTVVIHQIAAVFTKNCYNVQHVSVVQCATCSWQLYYRGRDLQQYPSCLNSQVAQQNYCYRTNKSTNFLMEFLYIVLMDFSLGALANSLAFF